MTSAKQKPARQSARTENWAVFPCGRCNGVRVGGNKVRSTVKCEQVHILKYEARAQLQENTKMRSAGLVRGSHTKVHSETKQTGRGLLWSDDTSQVNMVLIKFCPSICPVCYTLWAFTLLSWPPRLPPQATFPFPSSFPKAPSQSSCSIHSHRMLNFLARKVLLWVPMVIMQNILPLQHQAQNENLYFL